jgi:molecular chaperone DnaK
MYRELLNESPHDPQLLAETRVLRTKLLLPSQAPQRRVSAKPPPPPPPPPRSQRALPAPSRPAEESQVRAQTRGLERAPALPSVAPGAPPPLPTPIPAQEEADNASQFPAPPSIAPLLLDVTPHTLCVETVGGFCECIIERNAPIPTEQTRIFTTSRDNQTTVSVRVSQGESRSTDENQVLGHIELLALRPAQRGEVNIAVTFAIDVDGTLNVRAIDQATGRGQELRVNLTGAIDAHELERMRAKQQVLAS